MEGAGDGAEMKGKKEVRGSAACKLSQSSPLSWGIRLGKKARRISSSDLGTLGIGLRGERVGAQRRNRQIP